MRTLKIPRIRWPYPMTARQIEDGNCTNTGVFSLPGKLRSRDGWVKYPTCWVNRGFYFIWL